MSKATTLRTRLLGYDQRAATLFLLPMMLVLGLVAVFPVLYSFWISLFDLKLTRPHRAPFVWFDNYAKLFADDLFWTSVLRTTSFTADVSQRDHDHGDADGNPAQRGVPGPADAVCNLADPVGRTVCGQRA